MDVTERPRSRTASEHPKRRAAGAAPAPARAPGVAFVFVSERGSPFTTAGFALVLATGSGALMAIAAVLLGSVRSVRQ
jgi:hypothetical protein